MKRLVFRESFLRIKYGFLKISARGIASAARECGLSYGEVIILLRKTNPGNIRRF